jgi:hypothetical protein
VKIITSGRRILQKDSPVGWVVESDGSDKYIGAQPLNLGDYPPTTIFEISRIYE